MSSCHRHDLSDHAGSLFEPHLPGRPGARGGPRSPPFSGAVSWILRTGTPWRDSSPDEGDGKNSHRRSCRWRDKGIREALPGQRVEGPDLEWRMMDTGDTKGHLMRQVPGGNPAMGCTEGGSTRKHMWSWRAQGLPVTVAMTEGRAAACEAACPWMEGMGAGALSADGACDPHAILPHCEAPDGEADT